MIKATAIVGPVIWHYVLYLEVRSGSGSHSRRLLHRPSEIDEQHGGRDGVINTPNK